MIPRIDYKGRILDQITSEEGQRNYFNHFNYCRCGMRDKPVIKPTQDDAIEYKRLRSLVKNHTLSPCKKIVRIGISMRNIIITMIGAHINMLAKRV